MTTVSEALAVAHSHHQRGELAQAKAIYRQIVDGEPRHADAWHLLGVVADQQGRNDEAVEALSRAVAINGNQLDYHMDLGAAYAGLSKLEQAETSFRRALALCQTDALIHHNLAVLFSLRGKSDDAIEHYRLAVELNPRMTEAHFNLGKLLRDREEWAAAEASYKAGWQQVCEIRRETVARNPQDVDAQKDLGTVLQLLERIAEAKVCYRRALELRPGDRAATYNMGSALLTEGNSREAEGYFRELITSGGGSPDVHFRLGQCLQFEGRFAEAVACHDRAIAGKPNDADYHYFRATARLTSGDFAGAWPEYEWRLKSLPEPPYRQPRWQGEDLDGQGIVIYAEFGLGDTLQFVRYLPLVEGRGGNVHLAVQPALIPLLKESGFKQVVAWRGDALPQCQLQVPLLSLPGIFGTVLETIPATVPYLKAKGKLVETWRKRLSRLGGFKVGIHWHGRKVWATDLRTIPLMEFELLTGVEGVTLISLQTNDGSGQLEDLGDRFRIVDFGHELDAKGGAFMDTAAIMQHLDLVISNDTSIAHVAGALGAPVWVALPRGSEWRWLWDRSDSPWYPTMRLFRQPRFGEWARVFSDMANELRRIVRQRDQRA